MPLTPAEVHNVAFKKPPIGKRGYDEEEVDAFLDIVEVELSRLIEENNDLRARGGSTAAAAAPAGPDNSAELAGLRDDNSRLKAHIGELERAMNQAAASGKEGAQQQQQIAALQQQIAQVEQQLAESRRQLEQAKQQAEQARAQAAQAGQRAQQPAADAGTVTGTASEQHAKAVQVLALAQQTADQHLAQSKAEADRLLAEARTNADSALNDAKAQSSRHLTEAENRAKQIENETQTKAAQTLQEAEQRATTITAQFEQRKAALERRVDELRTFEREYRTRLKSYLESQLRDLDASGKAEPAGVNATKGEFAEAQG
jgi:DivIVA domain-containing protein